MTRYIQRGKSSHGHIAKCHGLITNKITRPPLPHTQTHTSHTLLKPLDEHKFCRFLDVRNASTCASPYLNFLVHFVDLLWIGCYLLRTSIVGHEKGGLCSHVVCSIQQTLPAEIETASRCALPWWPSTSSAKTTRARRVHRRYKHNVSHAARGEHSGAIARDRNTIKQRLGTRALKASAGPAYQV